MVNGQARDGVISNLFRALVKGLTAINEETKNGSSHQRLF
jgi:hypothetical protein